MASRSEAGGLRGGLGGLGLTLALAGMLACSTPFVSVGEGDQQRLEHQRLGYRIARPGPPDTWTACKQDGTDLCFAAADGAVMSLMSECVETDAGADVLAQHLLIGTLDRALRSSHPVEHEGLPGWLLVVDSLEDGVPFRLKTVTLRSPVCTFDFVLVSSSGFREPEEVFDAWWASFVPPAAVEDEAGEKSGEGAPGEAPDDEREAGPEAAS